MGCGAAKEAVEEPADQQQHHEPKKDREKEEVAVEAIDDRPPLTKSQIFEIFNAGSVKPNVPPLYMPLDAGPFVTREKVPSQTHSSGRFLVSGDVAPARQVDDAAAAALRSPTLHLDNDGVLLRAYFPHSLSGYCVGQCRPDLSAGQLLPGFRYDVEVEGAMDERAIALSKPVAREPSQRRRVLLFPATIDAVGLFVTVDGATKTTRVVAPYNGTCATAPEVEPIEGAFATYSMLTHSSNQDHDNQSLISASPRTVAPALPTRHSKREIGAVLTSSSTIYTETSLGFTLLPSPRPIAKPDAVGDTVERRLPEDAVTPARSVGALGHIPAARRGSLHSGVEAAFAEALCGLDDGAHTVQLSLRFRYATDSFVAVYDKPAPVAGTTGLRIVGSYIAHTISSSAADQLSETIAMGDCTIMMDSNGRAHLTDMCRSQH